MTTDTAPQYYETLPAGWGYDSSPCFNCGDCDHCIRCTQWHRWKCGQTWYPRLAPYCQADWGWTQPCWRRMADNYNCPSAEPMTTRMPLLPAGETPPAGRPQLPPLPPPATSSTAPALRARYANRAPVDMRGSVARIRYTDDYERTQNPEPGVVSDDDSDDDAIAGDRDESTGETLHSVISEMRSRGRY